MSLVYDKTVGEKTIYSIDGDTQPLIQGGWSGEHNLIPYSIMNFRYTNDLNAKNAIRYNLKT